LAAAHNTLKKKESQYTIILDGSCTAIGVAIDCVIYAARQPQAITSEYSGGKGKLPSDHKQYGGSEKYRLATPYITAGLLVIPIGKI
jgi:hypothetical protein